MYEPIAWIDVLTAPTISIVVPFIFDNNCKISNANLDWLSWIWIGYVWFELHQFLGHTSEIGKHTWGLSHKLLVDCYLTHGLNCSRSLQLLRGLWYSVAWRLHLLTAWCCNVWCLQLLAQGRFIIFAICFRRHDCCDVVSTRAI